jgi:hypothetical protein
MTTIDRYAFLEVFPDTLDFIDEKSLLNNSFNRTIKLRTKDLAGNKEKTISLNINYDFINGSEKSLKLVKQLDSNVKLYTKETLFFEKDKELKDALATLFHTENASNILTQKRYMSNGKMEYFFVKDFNPDLIDKVYFEYTSATVTSTYGKTIETTPEEDNELIATVLEKNAVSYFVKNAIAEHLKNSIVSDEYLTAVQKENMASENIYKLYKQVFIETNPDINALSELFGISSEKEIEEILSALRSNNPLTQIRDYVSAEKTVSPLLNNEFGREISVYAPIIDIESASADEVRRNIESTSAFFAPRSMAKPSIIKDALDQGMKNSDFLYPYAAGDEELGIEDEIMPALISVSSFNGSSKLNGITKLGFASEKNLNEHTSTVASEMFHRGRITDKAVLKLDMSQSFADDLLKKYLASEYNNARSFAVKSPKHENLVYIFTYSGSNNNFRKQTPSKEELLNSLIDVDNFHAQQMRILQENSTVDLQDGLEMSFSSIQSYNMMHASKAFAFSIQSRANTLKDLNRWQTEIASGKLIENVRQKKEISKLVQTLPSESINSVLSVSNISPKEKAFPDILHVNSKRKYSLEDISKNFIFASRYLQLPGFSDTVLHLMKVNGLPYPKTPHFILNLEDPSKNDIGDKKDVVAAPDDSLGVLNYKYIPVFIDISTDNAKDIFIKNVMLSLGNAIKEYETPVDPSSIEKTRKSLKESVSGGKYIIMKTKKDYNAAERIFYNKEVFTIANENLDDIGTLPIDPMYFFQTIKQEGILNIRDRVTEATLSLDSSNTIFNSIDAFISNAISKYREKYLDAKTEEIINALAKEGMKLDVPSISKEALDKLYQSYFKKTEIVTLVKSIIGENRDVKTISHETLREASKMGVEIDSIDSEIAYIERYLNAKFYGKEHIFGLEINKYANKELFDRYFAGKDYSETLWSLMIGVSTYDNTVKMATMRIVETFRLGKHISMLKENMYDEKNDAAKKSNTISAFLYSCLGLSSHQLLETKAFVSSSLDGKKDMELLFWEMRTGKTRTMIAQLMLLSMAKKQNSMFFVQGKNFDDIIMQAFEMNPLIVSEMSVFIENQSRFNMDGYKIPVPLSDDIYPNIPRALKSKKILRNPDPNDLENVSVRLSEDFIERFQSIANTIGDNINAEYEKYSQHVLAEFPDGEKHLLHHSMLMQDSYKNSIASGYYVLWLANEGYIEKSQATAKEVFNRVFKGVIDEINEEKERYSSKNGQIIFSSKKHIDSFSAEVLPTKKVYEPEKAKSLSVFSKKQINVEVKEHHHVDTKKNLKNADTIIEEEVSNFLISLAIPEVLEVIANSNKALLPFNVETNGFNIHDSLSFRHAAITSSMQFSEQYFLKNAKAILEIFMDETLVTGDKREEYEKALSSFSKSVFRGLGQVISEANAIQKWHQRTAYPLVTLDTSGTMEASVIDVGKIDTSAIVSHMVANRIDEADADVIALFKEKIFKSESIAKAISQGGYMHIIESIYIRAQYRNLASMLAARLGVKTEAQSISTTISLQNAMSFPLPVYKQKIDGVSTFEYILDVIKLSTMANSAATPHLFKPEDVQTTSLSIKANANRTEIELGEFVSEKEHDLYIKDFKNTASSLSTKFFWKIKENSNVSAIAIDETHKNTGERSAFQTKGLFTKLEELYPGSAKICATGTPLSGLSSFARLIETIANAKGAQISKMIQKYCGNYKYKNDSIALIASLYGTDAEFAFALREEILPHYINDKTSFVYATAEEIWEMDSVRSALEDIDGDFSDTIITYGDFKEGIRSVLDMAYSVFNSELSKTERALLGDVEDIRRAIIESDPISEALFTGHYSLVNPAAGFNNPSAMASAIAYMDNANTSIRRPSKDISYNIYDKKQKVTAGADYLSSNRGSLSSAILAVDSANRRYAKINLISKIKETLVQTIDILIQSVLKNPSTLGFTSVQEASLSMLRSQKTVEDGIVDYYDKMINSKEMPFFESPEKEKTFMWTIARLEPFFNNIKDIKKAAAEALEANNVEFEFTINEEKYIFSTDTVLALATKHVAYGGYRIDFDMTNKTSKVDPKAKFVSFENGMPFLRGPKTDEYIHFRVPLNINPIGRNFPVISFDHNPSNLDDRAIMEALAFSEDTISLVKEHIDKGENTRLMTTRVVITEAAVSIIVASAMERKDREPFNIIVNSTDQRISKHIAKIKDTLHKELTEANIKIWEESPATINMVMNELSGKKERLSIVGNYESLAEGYNMEFVQSGFYLGAVHKSAEAIQSFARQLGFNSKQSSFYLYNNGHLSSLIPCVENGKAIKTLSDDIHSLVNSTITKETAQAIYTSATAITGNLKPGQSFIVKTNATRYKDLVAYEKFVNGNLISEGDISPEDISTWVINNSNEENNDIVIEASVINKP